MKSLNICFINYFTINLLNFIITFLDSIDLNSNLYFTVIFNFYLALKEELFSFYLINTNQYFNKMDVNKFISYCYIQFAYLESFTITVKLNFWH